MILITLLRRTHLDPAERRHCNPIRARPGQNLGTGITVKLRQKISGSFVERGALPPQPVPHFGKALIRNIRELRLQVVVRRLPVAIKERVLVNRVVQIGSVLAQHFQNQRRIISHVSGRGAPRLAQSRGSHRH